MTANFRSWWRSSSGPLAFALAALLLPRSVSAESPACNRAKAIVDEVRSMFAASTPDHAAILAKLKTAHQLCPTFGDAWKYAHCSALAMGDEPSARRFRDRALFNNVKDIECGGTGVATPPPAMPGYVRQKHALVIGIGKFADSNIRPLQFAAKDARDFAAALTDPRHGNFPRENVTLLTDEGATRERILNAMQELFLRAQEDDLVVIFVSSHGSSSDRNKGLGGIGYIVTYDTKANEMWIGALEYDDFGDKASMIRARRKVTFLDTCYSGQGRPGEKALAIEGGVDDRTARMFLSGEGSFVITSSDESERSWESDKIQNGYFTYYLIDALKRSEEPATIKEIYAHLSSKVPDAVARDKKQQQHPQLYPSTGPGDVRIGVVAREVENP